MRIAFLANPNETLVREWMAHFVRRGHVVSLIVRAGAEISPGLETEISVHRIPPYHGMVLGRLRAPRARRAIGQVLAEIRPDILHVHDLTTGYGWLAWLSGYRPYVLSAWGSDVYFALSRSRTDRIVARLQLRDADLVTANSDDLRRATIRMGARPSRIHTIHAGIDLARFYPAQPDPALRSRLQLEGSRVVFSPRQIAPLYEHVSVVRALAALPSDVVLLLSAHNAHPDYLRAIRECAAHDGVEHRLRIVPTIDHDEMAAYLRLADVVVSVPRSDAAAATILEALACGRPVVASALPSPKEWLGELSPELLVPVGDDAAIAAAVSLALSLDPETARRRANAGISMILARGERHESMLRMERLYRSAVAAWRRSPV